MTFAMSEKGRRIPLDPEPNEAGNVYVEIVDGVIVAHVGKVGDPDMPGAAYYCHFASCPVLNKGRAKKSKPPAQPDLGI